VNVAVTTRTRIGIRNNMKMTGWIQSADFGTKNLAKMDMAKAIQTFAGHDWNSERQLEANLLSRKEESCPAGFGLDHPDGHRLRLETCWVIFTRNSKRKLLGFIPLPNYELESENLPHEMIDELISEFYQDASAEYAKIESIKNM